MLINRTMPYNRKKNFIQTRKNVLQYGRQGASFKRRYGTPTPWKSANPNVQKKWKRYTAKLTRTNKPGKRMHKRGITTIKNFNFTKKKKERKPRTRKTVAGLNIEQVMAVAAELQKEAAEKEIQMENNASGIRRSTRTRKAPTNALAETKKAENARKAQLMKERKEKAEKKQKEMKEEKRAKEEAAKGPHYAKSHVSKSSTLKNPRKAIASKKAVAAPVIAAAAAAAPLSVIPESPVYSSNTDVNNALAERFTKLHIKNNAL
jgi:hypothetical protein